MFNFLAKDENSLLEIDPYVTSPPFSSPDEKCVFNVRHSDHFMPTGYALGLKMKVSLNWVEANRLRAEYSDK